MEKKIEEDNQNKIIKEIKEIHVINEKPMISEEMRQFHERCKKFYEILKNQKGIIFIKSFIKSKNNLNIKLNNKSFCKIIDQGFLMDRLLSYIINTIVNETTLEIASSTELFDNNDYFSQIFENKNKFPVTMKRYMDLPSNERINKLIFLKNKSVKNILIKIGGSLNDNFTYIQLLLMEFSYDYDSIKSNTEYIIVDRYHFLLDSKKVFYISYNTKKNDDEEDNEEEEIENYPVSFYSIKKILNMSDKDENKKENYLDLMLLDKETEEFEKENNLYIKKLTKSGGNLEIYDNFENNKEKYLKSIFDKKVEINRMKKTENKEMNIYFDICDKILNNKEFADNLLIQIKKNEIEDEINNRYNLFIEIMHNNKDKKYINLQYLDLIEDFNKKNNGYKIDNYSVKNDRFEDIKIPSECIQNYMRYKTEYENKKFVLIDLNNDNKNENKYLVSVNDLKKLYDEWTILDQEHTINTENPQFEGKKINLNKVKIIKIEKMKELPEQPSLIKEKKEEKDKIIEEKKEDENKEEGKEKKEENILNSSLRKHPEIYGNIKDRKFITIRRRIIKKKKTHENKQK